MFWFLSRFNFKNKNAFVGSKEFEGRLGYKFKQKDLLKTALSHRSYIHTKKLELSNSNERL